MSVIFSNCAECEYFKAEKIEGNEYRYYCKAFPNEIPGDFMFRKSQDEDEECNNGIKFKRDEA